MSHVFKLREIEFQLKGSPVPEYLWHTSPDLSKLADSKNLNFFVRSLDQGKYSYPYHSHRNAEELFVVLSGKAMLRTPEGFRELEEGDIAFFEMGDGGAHQLYNHTEQPFIYLDLGTKSSIDVCDYPDTGKTGFLPYRELYKKNGQADYFEGEENVSDKWPAEITGRRK
jgi:uncharacterized cupin superfamily protein